MMKREYDIKSITKYEDLYDDHLSAIHVFLLLLLLGTSGMIRTESLTDVYFFTFRMCQHILTFAQPGDSTYTISLHHLSKYDTTVHISICDNLNNGNVPPAGDPRSLTISSRNFLKIPITFHRYFPKKENCNSLPFFFGNLHLF